MVELLDLGAVICEGGGLQREALDNRKHAATHPRRRRRLPREEEVCRVAQRLAVPVIVVSNSRTRVPDAAGIELVVVPSGQLDDVDDWIAERATAYSTNPAESSSLGRSGATTS